MLDRRPDRAQAPIVEGRNRTLAAARMSAASASVIQSADEGIAQSPSFDEEPPDVEAEEDALPEDDEPPEDDSPEDDSPEVDSPEVDALLEVEALPPSPPPLAEAPSPPDSPAFDDAALDARVELLPRSFFAQPEPLKWIVGGANCLRIVPSRPHDGQNLGPGSLIPWMMSAR